MISFFRTIIFLVATIGPWWSLLAYVACQLPAQAQEEIEEEETGEESVEEKDLVGELTTTTAEVVLGELAANDDTLLGEPSQASTTPAASLMTQRFTVLDVCELLTARSRTPVPFRIRDPYEMDVDEGPPRFTYSTGPVWDLGDILHTICARRPPLPVAHIWLVARAHGLAYGRPGANAFTLPSICTLIPRVHKDYRIFVEKQPPRLTSELWQVIGQMELVHRRPPARAHAPRKPSRLGRVVMFVLEDDEDIESIPNSRFVWEPRAPRLVNIAQGFVEEVEEDDRMDIDGPDFAAGVAKGTVESAVKEEPIVDFIPSHGVVEDAEGVAKPALPEVVKVVGADTPEDVAEGDVKELVKAVPVVISIPEVVIGVAVPALVAEPLVEENLLPVATDDIEPQLIDAVTDARTPAECEGVDSAAEVDEPVAGPSRPTRNRATVSRLVLTFPRRPTTKKKTTSVKTAAASSSAPVAAKPNKKGRSTRKSSKSS